MDPEDRATENLLAIALGEAKPTEHLDRRDAMAELLDRLYSQDVACTQWGRNVEERLEELEERVGGTALDAPLSETAIAHAKRLNAIRKWCDRHDGALDELHDRVSELTARIVGGADLGLEDRVDMLEEDDGPMPIAQVMDQVAFHAERAAELTERALEIQGEGRDDYLAAAKIHNQTARALATVVDHRRAER